MQEIERLKKQGFQPGVEHDGVKMSLSRRKGVKELLREMRLENGDLKGVTRAQMQGAVELALNLRESDLVGVRDNEEMPMLMRLVCQYVLDSQVSSKVFEMLMDRAFGKPVQAVVQDSRVELIINELRNIVPSGEVVDAQEVEGED